MSNIFLEKDILNALEYYLKINFSQNKEIVVITDDNVKSLYHEFINKLEFTKLISIRPGEGSKSRAIKAYIEDEMLKHGCLRDTLIIAFGGGVVLDLAGFVAATFCRGIPIIYIPTTLLAQVDASVGGKNGINTDFGKNLLGTFKQPDAVFISQEFLNTLPDVEYFSAYAEIIKHALISDKSYFNFLMENSKKVKAKDSDFLAKIIKRSIEIKLDIVKKDATEKNLRAVLNFGHTVGHAIEKAFDYKISHGQAVAYGILAESYISYNLNFLSKVNYEKIISLLEKFNFNNLLLPNLDIDTLLSSINFLKYDKKNLNNEIRLVLLNNIGEVVKNNNVYTYQSTISTLERSLKYLSKKDLINIDASIY